MKIILSEEQIKKLIAKPAHSELLDKAVQNQKLLQQFYDNSYPELIYDGVRPLLTQAKFDKFKIVYQNHGQNLVDRVKKHYQKVFSASGKSTFFDFGQNVDMKEAFLQQKETMFEGTSDEKFFSETGKKLAMTQPNSIYIVGSVNQDGQQIIKVKHISLDEIHDIKSSVTGIRYCIIKQEIKNDKNVKCRYFVYDDMFFSVWVQNQSGIVIDPDWGTRPQPHNNSVCPVTWVYDDDLSSTNHIEKKSVYNDSVKDLFEYTVLKTFYQNYKYFGAFGKEIKLQTQCRYENIKDNVRCNGTGTLHPLNSELPHRFPLRTAACPDCANKNKGVMGEIFEIPIQQQGNESLMSNYSRLNFRIEADSQILTFHKEDVEHLKKSILVDCIGQGYGESYKNQAFNQDQVAINFDDQETNLNYFKHKIEKSWNFCLERAAEIFAPESFQSISIKLGTKYFLKTIDQLYDELKRLYEGTNNSALIQQKQMEILLTENKNDFRTIKRFELVRALKPFSSFPLEYIKENRQSLQEQQPKSILLFDNFDQIMSIFEMRFGKIENMLIDEFNQNLLITNISNKFKEILVELNPETNVGQQTEPEGQPET